MNEGLTERDFQRFRSLIYEKTGIQLSESKRAMLAGRLSKRLRALDITEYRAYLARVSESSEELVRMLDVVTTNETRFFREQKQFDFLREQLIPKWKREAEAGLRRPAVTVWSAGCSTGEEPYSLAMTLLAGLGDAWSISVVATDLSTRALSSAANGLWSIERSSQIPQEYLKAFMLRGHGSQIGKMKAGPELRSVITFRRLNLNDADYRMDTRFDLVLCRNVLIYFAPESRRRVLDRLLEHVLPGGHFFIGHAETLNGLGLPVTLVAPTIYRRNPAEGAAR